MFFFFFCSFVFGFMASPVMLLCKYGLQILPIRLGDGIMLKDVLSKIGDKWKKLCIGSFSLSYALGESYCSLDNEDDFDNMLFLYKGSERINVNIDDVKSSNGVIIGSCSGPSGEVVTGAVDDSDMEEPLEKFCRHAETRYLTEGWANLINQIGQVFSGGVTHFREVLQKYSVENGFMYEFVKNDKYRVTAKCSIATCGWRVHAILNRTNGEFRIKDLVNEHRCGSTYRTNRHKRVTSTLVANEITSIVQNKNKTSPMDMVDFFTDKYGLELPYYHAWLGVEKARGVIFGGYEESFDKLRWYVDAAKVSNPGSVLKLEIDPVSKEFSRLFVSFNACIQGFNHCRPFLCVDGAHLKGRFKGCLLAATGKDGDQGIFVFSYLLNVY